MTGPAAAPAAVLWDMDGTLVDSEKVWDVALSGLAHRLGGELSEPARLAMVGTNMTVSIGVLFADLGLTVDAVSERDSVTWLLTRAAQLYSEPLPWRPGAVEALAMVRAAGIPCALVTNTEREITELGLNTLGRANFEVTVCGDEVPAPKPAPDVYLRAASLLGVPPSRCVAVEDSPTGVMAAEAAGCTVLVVPCVMPVPPGPRRVLRDTLIGLTLGELKLL